MLWGERAEGDNRAEQVQLGRGAFQARGAQEAVFISSVTQ